MNLPEVLEQALAAENAYNACDFRVHPRTSTRLHRALSVARVALAAEYPQLEAWLFDYHHRAERRAELRRLLDEVRP